MNTRSSVLIPFLFTGIVLLLAGGCDDVALNVERPPERPGRAAPTPIAPAPVTDATPPAPAAQTSQPAPEEAPVVSARAFQQLVLLSEPGPEETPPGVEYLHLRRAVAAEVGRLVAWLYIPAGPAGSRDRFCLVYPSTIEADAAARLARELDLPAVEEVGDEPLPQEGADAFAQGIGLLYGQPPDEPPDPQRFRRVEAALTRATNDTALPAMGRWIAAMIAGRAAAELQQDPATAERHFIAAERFASPGSLEQLATWLAKATAQIQNGAHQTARELLTRILTEFRDFEHTELYERAGRALAEIGIER